MKYLVSYATLMRNYFLHMNFEDIVADLSQNEIGRKLLVVALMIVAPS